MTTTLAPVFSKDGNDYLVAAGPAGIVAGLVYGTVEEAKAAGAEAGLQNTYGFVATGEVVLLEDGQYQAPYVIATVGDKQAWIIGGPVLDGLLDARHPAVENIQPEPPTVPPSDTTKDEASEDVEPNLVETLLPLVADVLSDVFTAPTAEPATEPTFGGGGGFDGAGAGGAI